MTNEDKKAASEAARYLGSIKTEKKAAAVRENGKLGGRPLKPLNEYPCTCGGAEGKHIARCPRGRAIRYRQQKGLPLE